MCKVLITERSRGCAATKFILTPSLRSEKRQGLAGFGPLNSILMDFALLDFALVGFALVVFALVWLTLVGFAVVDIARLSSAIGTAEFKLFSGKSNDTPGSSITSSEKMPWRFPSFPGCPAASESWWEALVSALSSALFLSLVLSLVSSLVLSLGLNICSTGKRQTDNRQERVQSNCGNFLAFDTANDGGFPVLFAARAFHRRRRRR